MNRDPLRNNSILYFYCEVIKGAILWETEVFLLSFFLLFEYLDGYVVKSHIADFMGALNM